MIPNIQIGSQGYCHLFLYVLSFLRSTELWEALSGAQEGRGQSLLCAGKEVFHSVLQRVTGAITPSWKLLVGTKISREEEALDVQSSPADWTRPERFPVQWQHLSSSHPAGKLLWSPRGTCIATSGPMRGQHAAHVNFRFHYDELVPLYAAIWIIESFKSTELSCPRGSNRHIIHLWLH